MSVAILAYGMGVNSTGLLCGMTEKGLLPPHAILSADTDGELPRTYAYRDMFSGWLESQGYPPITVVRVPGEGLEANCLRRKALPSVAYGFKTCSQRWKLDPQEKWANNDPACIAAWARGEKVTRLIGYHADETQRAKPYSDDKYVNRYLLIEWGWGQEECLSAIDRAGLPRPGKSACFFCPNSKPSEIRGLAVDYPPLIQRALAMEANAALDTVKGLGRNFSWADLLNQGTMFPEMYGTREMPCGCFDGE